MFIVRAPYLCLTGITCLRCGVSFTTNLLHITSHTDAIVHVRSATYVGGDFHRLRPGLRPGRQGCAPCPIMPQRVTFPWHPGQWGSDCPRERLSHGTPTNGVEIATESDFPMTPHPMRVEISSDSDSLTPEEKGI